MGCIYQGACGHHKLSQCQIIAYQRDDGRRDMQLNGMI